MRGQRLAALLAGAQDIGRQPQVGLLRRRLIGRRLCASAGAVLGIGASLTAGRARSPVAVPSPSCARPVFAPRRRPAPCRYAVPGPMYFSRPIAPASGPGRRDVSTATAVSAAVEVAASVRLRLAAGSSSPVRPAWVARVGADGLAVTMTGILPRCAGSVGRCGAARRGFGRLRLGGAAALEELLDLLDFFLGQAGQRRPFARDAGLRADVDQFLAVKLQLFR